MSRSHACIGCLFKSHSIHWPIHVLIVVSWYLRRPSCVDHFRTKRVLRIIYIFSDGSNAFFFPFWSERIKHALTTTRPVLLWSEKQAHENAWTVLPGPGWPALTKGACSPRPFNNPLPMDGTTSPPSTHAVMQTATNGTAELETILNTRRLSSTGQPLPNTTTLVVKSKATVLGRTRVE